MWGLTQKCVFSQLWRLEVQVPPGLVTPQASPLCLQRVTLLLPLHMIISLYMCIPGVSFMCPNFLFVQVYQSN